MNVKILWVGVSLTALTCAGLVHAQSNTETYEYDALGRLIKVETTAGEKAGETREITYDGADNRSNYKATGGALPPGPSPSPSPSQTEAEAKAALEADFASRTNSGMWDLRDAANGGSFTAANIMGGLPSLTGGPVEAVSSSTGAQFLNGDHIQVTVDGTFNLYLLIRKDPASANGMITNNTWPEQVWYTDGDSGLASGMDMRFYRNDSFGFAVASHDELHDELNDDQFHSLKLGQFVFDGGDTLRLGRSGTGMEADVVAVVILDTSEVGQLEATETLIANWFADIAP